MFYKMPPTIPRKVNVRLAALNKIEFVMKFDASYSCQSPKK